MGHDAASNGTRRNEQPFTERGGTTVNRKTNDRDKGQGQQPDHDRDQAIEYRRHHQILHRMPGKLSGEPIK